MEETPESLFGSRSGICATERRSSNQLTINQDAIRNTHRDTMTQHPPTLRRTLPSDAPADGSVDDNQTPSLQDDRSVGALDDEASDVGRRRVGSDLIDSHTWRSEGKCRSETRVKL